MGLGNLGRRLLGSPAGKGVEKTLEQLQTGQVRRGEAVDLTQPSVPAPELQFEPIPLKDPAREHATISDEYKQINANSQTWRHISGWEETKQKDLAAASAFERQIIENHTLQGVAGNGFYTRMYTSQSPTANWLAGTVFESANAYGRGQATSSIRQDVYAARILGPSTGIDRIRNDWAIDNGVTLGGSGFSISGEGRRALNRQVMLERNERAMGRATAEGNAQVKAIADVYDEMAVRAHEVGTGRKGERAIDGFEEVDINPHYTRYIWQGKNMKRLIDDGVTDKAKLVKGLSDGYKAAGINGKDTAAIANAVINRALAGELDIDTSVFGLLNAEGQEFLKESLTASIGEVEADAIIRRLIGHKGEQTKAGFAKRRNDIDMAQYIETNDGSELQVVDLLSQDLDQDWHRYARQMSGAGALARQGITNRRQRLAVAETIQMEQRQLGEEPTDINEIMAMFSNFDGGPVKGFSRLEGGDPAVQSMYASVAKRAANLAYLGKLGFAQLGETGMAVASMGAVNFAERALRPLINAQSKAAREQIVDELGFLTGKIGYDHKVFADHLALDEVSAHDGTWLTKANGWVAKGAEMQSYLSFFNHIRSWQQKVAASGVADKLFRAVRDDTVDDAFLARAWDDLGLTQDDFVIMKGLVDNGTIKFTPEGFVDRLNVDEWPTEFQEVFGAGIMRNINQLVQKSMAGEQDAWMSTTVGSIMTHLKTFPMQAVNKQFLRMMRRGGLSPEMAAAVFAGMGTAMTALTLKHFASGKSAEEYDIQATARNAVSYSNLTGWVPFYYDTVMTVLGMDDYKVNPYRGPEHINASVMPAAATWAQDAFYSVAAIRNTLKGEAQYKDKKALKALPGSNLPIWSNILNGVGQTGEEGTGNFSTRNRESVQEARAEEEQEQQQPTQQQPSALTARFELMKKLNE